MELVIDRTKADVDRVLALRAKGWEGMSSEEKAYWLRGSPIALYALDGPLEALDGSLHCRDGIIKGAYNAVDLNRVEAAAAYLSELLGQYGYLVEYVPHDAERAVEHIPTLNDMERYLGNVQTLKYGFYGSVPLPTTMDGLTHTQANNIEKLLLEIETIIGYTVQGFRRCGTFTSGQGVVLP